MITIKKRQQMKIVEISCPSCGGKLKLEDSRFKLITCAYCGNQFFGTDEKPQNTTNYSMYQPSPVRVLKEPSPKSGWDQGVGVAVYVAVIMVVFFVLVGLLLFLSSSSKEDSAPSAQLPAFAYTPEFQEQLQIQEEAPESQLYDAMLQEMFQKTAGITREELERVTYLKVKTTLDEDHVWYSFDDPYAESPDIRSVSFAAMDWDARDIGNFTGLVKLELENGLPGGMDLSALTRLRGLRVTGAEPSEIKDMVADPEQITELALQNIHSMEGISAFVNLERLSIRDMPDTNLKQLVALKNLKELSLEDSYQSDSVIMPEEGMRVTDYSAISAMTSLESLSVASDAIRDVGFLQALPHLTSLTLEDSSVISLAPLEKATGLRSLCLIDNDKLQDYDAVSRMTWLRDLTIEKMTSQPDPDLSALSVLERLDISGFMSVSCLGGLTRLRELSVHSCNVDGAEALSTLTGVERLTFYSVWNSARNLTDLNFLDGMTNLKYADFNGNLDETGWSGYQYSIEVNGDVSSVFNHPGLQELYLDHGTFEIDFDRIRENTSLRVLSLKGMELHENYDVESYGGMTDIWYDDVKLGEHLDFLSNFPALEELYLDSNELTDVEFAAGLKNLTRLSVQDNYITDLSPLIQAEHLTYLNISDNPVEGSGGIQDDVYIVK